MSQVLFDQEDAGQAPPGAPVVQVISAAFGALPDPAAAIIAASPQVELFDEDLWDVPKRHFAPVVTDDFSQGGGTAIADQLRAAREADSFPVVLSDRLDPLSAIVAAGGAGTVFLASGRPHLEAGGVIRDLAETGATRIISAGMRAMSAGEARWIETAPDGYQAFIEARGHGDLSTAAMALSEGEGVILAIDLGVLDASVMPSVAVPLPGGASWDELLSAVRMVVRRGRLSGVVMFGLVPHPALHASDFLAAKLLYKILAYRFCAV